jgi:hypothetical protein
MSSVRADRAVELCVGITEVDTTCDGGEESLVRVGGNF